MSKTVHYNATANRSGIQLAETSACGAQSKDRLRVTDNPDLVDCGSCKRLFDNASAYVFSRAALLLGSR